MVGVPDEDVGTIQDAGTVNVLYGSADGLVVAGNELWHQDVAGVLGGAESGDRFGWASASGDFDGDGYADLAVGVPLEDIGDVADAGAVNVLYGTAEGLSANGNQIWHQDTVGIPDTAEQGDRFGASLAGGDFDADGFVDLAVGVPLEDWEGRSDAGVVHVLYGTAEGLTASGTQLWRQGGDGIPGAAEYYDEFGSALGAANHGRGRAADLAVGAPGESFSCGGFCVLNGVGAVDVIYGSLSGLTATGAKQFIEEETPGFDDEGARFGSALAPGNFGRGGLRDLAVGIPGSGIFDYDFGAVRVLYGTSTGLSTDGAQTFTQPPPETREKADEFGAALAAGNVGGTAHDDLVAAAPFDPIGDPMNAGAVSVFFGTVDGLTADGAQTWTQSSAGIADAPETGDLFGRAIFVANFGKSLRRDLAIGVPGEAVGPDADAGVLQVIYGSTGGLDSTGAQLWTQDLPGVGGSSEPGDHLGCSLVGSPSRTCT